MTTILFILSFIIFTNLCIVVI